MAKIVVMSDRDGRRELFLKVDIVVGRSEDCDLLLDGELISRRHARITVDGDDYAVEDLNSANGVYVNGRPVQRATLQGGDRIRVGECELMFLSDDDVISSMWKLQLDESQTTLVDAVDVDDTACMVSDLLEPALAAKLREHLKVLQDVAEVSCGALDIDALVERALDKTLHVYPQAEQAYAVLRGYGEDRSDLQFSMARDGAPPAERGMSRTLLQIATSERKAVLAGDTLTDERLAMAQSIVGQNVRSTMCSPLVMGPRVLGAIQVDTTSVGQPFNVDDLRLLVTVAGQIAVAAENARLHREAVAQQRLAAIGEAVSSIAHCIKNVLNGVQGGSYILDLGIKKQDSEKLTKGWDMVKRNVDFMSNLVKDMLAYCRKAGPRKEPTDMPGLLDETLKMVQGSAARAGVETSLKVNGELPRLMVDATGMKRAVLNLLTNAVEVCEGGGHVGVTARLDDAGRHMVISVVDDGPGMPPEVKKRLFEAFFTTKGNRGTGLGLALVQKVVEEHRGRVEVETQEGKGAAFHITIPLLDREAETKIE